MHVYLLENMPKRHRLWVTCLLTYSPNYILGSFIAYYAQEWRNFLLISSFLNLPAFCVLLIAFESPRWLIQHNKLDKARITLRRIELINGTKSERRMKLLDDLIQEEQKVCL